MKRKLYLSAITLVIAGLLITSVSGMMNLNNTQMMTEKEIEIEIETEDTKIETSGMYQLADIAIKNDINAAPKLSKAKVNKGTFERQIVSESKEVVQSRVMDQTRYTLIATHPALGVEPHIDGVSERGCIGHYYFYDDGAGVTDGPACLWQGTDDNFATWGPGLYYVSAGGDPFDWDYPSMHFRGYNSSNNETMFSGSARDGTVVGISNGGRTITVLCEGDPTVNASWTAFTWPWHNSGWHDALMAEAASALLPGYEWAWGFNSHVMSTTYGTYPVNDFRNNGCFINYQTDSAGMGTISWYLEFGGALSTDCIIDPVSTWIANATENPTDVDYAAYAVWDPSTFNGTTTFTHYLCIRAFDWYTKSPLDDHANAYDNVYWWNASVNYSMEHPAIAAHAGDVIILVEIVNMSNPSQVDIAFYNTHDGEPANISLSSYISLVTPGAIMNPEVQWVDGETFLAHFTIGNELLGMVSYDAGDSWEGPYVWYNATYPALINEYRNVDIADESRLSIWEVDNTTVPEEPQYLLRYTFNTGNYKGDCTYEYGDEADDLALVTITNENTSRVLPANLEDHGVVGKIEHYQRDLLYGLDLWSGAVMTIHAEDTNVPPYENTTTFTAEPNMTSPVETFDLTLFQADFAKLTITLTGGVGIHSAFDSDWADDYGFTVRATDDDGDPVAGILAGDFDLSIALGTNTQSWCPIAAHTTFTALDAQTDVDGEIDFEVEILTAVGRTNQDPTPNGGYVVITADHDEYESDSADIPVNTCDATVDGWINLGDFSKFQVDFGSDAQRSDYDFSEWVNLGDFSKFQVEFGSRQTC